MLNPAVRKKDMLTVVPTQYNHETAKLSMVIQNTIENEAVGIIVDDTDNNVVFDRISAKINETSNDFCAIKMGGINIIICPDEVNSVEELKKIITKEVVKYNTDKVSEKAFTFLDITNSENEYVQDEIEEMLMEMIENDIEVSEDLVCLTQLPLGKLVIGKKRLKDVQKLFELLGITNIVMNNAFYFNKSDKSIVMEYVDKLFKNEISVADRVYAINREEQTSTAIIPKQQEKHAFKYCYAIKDLYLSENTSPRRPQAGALRRRCGRAWYRAWPSRCNARRAFLQGS